MKICSSCGTKVSDENNSCTNCGSTNLAPTPVTEAVTPGDKGSILWGILGFLIPIVGLILYFAWKDTRPGDARMAGKGLLIAIIVSVVMVLLKSVL